MFNPIEVSDIVGQITFHNSNPKQNGNLYVFIPALKGQPQVVKEYRAEVITLRNMLQRQAHYKEANDLTEILNAVPV